MPRGYAGGIPALQGRIADRLNPDVEYINGMTTAQVIEKAEVYDDRVIRPEGNPARQEAGIWVLRGNLCADGALIKPSAASPHLMQHRGRAVVFETIEDYHARIDDPDLEIDETSVMVLKNVGPKGYPGMAEVGNMGLPKKLLEQGVDDMVRISDGRMSGTHFGCVVLHVSPESAVGGPLALVQDGDEIELDVPARSLRLVVDDAELERRRAAWQPPESPHQRGWPRLYVDHVRQASAGAGLDVLGGTAPRPEPYF